MDPYNSLQLSSKAAMDNSSYEERHQTSFRLFVPCVPAQNLRKDLHKYLSSFGEIVEIIYQKKDRGSAPPTRDDPTIGSGSCILVLRDAETRDRILQANPHSLAGRSITIGPFLVGKELQRHNEIQNKTRLFLKNFPKDTLPEQVGKWLKSLCVKPKFVHPVHRKNSPFVEADQSQIKSLTFNIQFHNVEDASYILSHSDLIYRSSKIRAEAKKPESNRNDAGYEHRHPSNSNTQYYLHNNQHQQIGSLAGRVNSNSLGSAQPTTRVGHKHQFRHVNTGIHVEPQTRLQPSIVRDHSSRTGTVFINNDLEPAEGQDQTCSSNSYGKNFKFASNEISQDSSPLVAHPKKSTQTLSTDLWKDLGGQTFSKHLKLRNTYCNINSQNKFKHIDETTNIRFNVKAPTKRSTESEVAVLDSSKKVSTVQL